MAPYIPEYLKEILLYKMYFEVLHEYYESRWIMPIIRILKFIDLPQPPFYVYQIDE